MAVLISRERLVPAWLEAAKHLQRHGLEGRNLVLEISAPLKITSEERVVLSQVDAALREHADLSILTVAGTIFPQGLYRRYGAEGLAERYLKIMERAQKPHTWGTYAMRLMSRRGRETGTTFNPLQQVINKLRFASTAGKSFHSNYELGVHLAEDLQSDFDVASCEVPTFDSALDGAKVSNMPCLSHLTFKMNGRSHVEVTAIYRSHYYGARALGNLVGLSHLLSFVASQSGLTAGSLTCISTHAVLDYKAWGGNVAGSALLNKLVL